MRRVIGIAVLAAAVCACAPEPTGARREPAAAGPPVEVMLVRASASGEAHDLLVRVTATLRNRSGAPLTVRSNFGGVFDGLTLVATAADGRELARQAYIYHQSPYAQDTPYVLPPGDTTRELVFPLAALKDPPAVVRLRLVGGLPGTPITAGLQSQVVTVAVADGRQNP
ncbi:MAG TPA: hypothetical protein VGQ83_32540 [Polyangia bacterium]